MGQERNQGITRRQHESGINRLAISLLENHTPKQRFDYLATLAPLRRKEVEKAIKERLNFRKKMKGLKVDPSKQ